MAKLRDDIEHNLPFISVLNYGDNEYVGIIINQDQYVTSFYDLNALRTPEEKTSLIEIGETWWWESNRLVPINVFLKQDWAEFRVCLKTFNSKDVEIKHGPYISLKEIAQKRSKRRSITLVRKVG